MKRKRTVRITARRQWRLSLNQIGIRIQCPVCGHEIELSTLAQAALALDTDEIVADLNFQRMLLANDVESGAMK